jgi:hypothetical protein
MLRVVLSPAIASLSSPCKRAVSALSLTHRYSACGFGVSLSSELRPKFVMLLVNTKPIMLNRAMFSIPGIRGLGGRYGHRIIVRGTRSVARCALDRVQRAKSLEIPLWMLEASCSTLRLAENPVVDGMALQRLKTLLHGVVLRRSAFFARRCRCRAAGFDSRAHNWDIAPHVSAPICRPRPWSCQDLASATSGPEDLGTGTGRPLDEDTQYGIRQFSTGRSSKHFMDPMAIARRERARIGS